MCLDGFAPAAKQGSRCNDGPKDPSHAFKNLQSLAQGLGVGASGLSVLCFGA